MWNINHLTTRTKILGKFVNLLFVAWFWKVKTWHAPPFLMSSNFNFSVFSLATTKLFVPLFFCIRNLFNDLKKEPIHSRARRDNFVIYFYGKRAFDLILDNIGLSIWDDTRLRKPCAPLFKSLLPPTKWNEWMNWTKGIQSLMCYLPNIFLFLFCW